MSGPGRDIQLHQHRRHRRLHGPHEVEFRRRCSDWTVGGVELGPPSVATTEYTCVCERERLYSQDLTCNSGCRAMFLSLEGEVTFDAVKSKFLWNTNANTLSDITKFFGLHKLHCRSSPMDLTPVSTWGKEGTGTRCSKASVGSQLTTSRKTVIKLLSSFDIVQALKNITVEGGNYTFLILV